MTQQYTAPQRPRRPASRLVAGLLWLVAAGTAVTATFSNIVIYVFTGGEAIFVVGFWRQYGLTAAGENSPGSIYYGAAEVGAAALLVLATLLAFLSTRRWAAIAAGALGTGMLVTSTLTWFLTALSRQANNTTTIEVGLWVLTGATAVALVAFLVSFLEREQPAPQQYYEPPTPPTGMRAFPPQQARWEPPTPNYGIPVEQEQPPAIKQEEPVVAEEPTERSERPSPSERTKRAEPAGQSVFGQEEDVFVEAFDHPEFTGSGSRPSPIPRDLRGDQQ